MNDTINLLLIILLFLNLYILSSSSIKTCIKIIAVEGFIIGALSLLLHGDTLSYFSILIGVSTIIIKAFILPYLIFRSLKTVNIKREFEPFISYTASVIIGIIFFIIGLIINTKVHFPGISGIYLSCPVAVMTSFTGLLLILSRKKAISQVLGYLVFENGIYLFGELLPLKDSYIIELGVLLDVFVFIFIVGITVFHIRSEFHHIDTDKLSHLSDVYGRRKKHD